MDDGVIIASDHGAKTELAGKGTTIRNSGI